MDALLEIALIGAPRGSDEDDCDLTGGRLARPPGLEPGTHGLEGRFKVFYFKALSLSCRILVALRPVIEPRFARQTRFLWNLAAALVLTAMQDIYI